MAVANRTCVSNCNQPKAKFGYFTRVTPVCGCLHPICGWKHLPTSRESKAYFGLPWVSACHLKMRGDRKINRLMQGRRSMVIDYYWTVSNENCKPTTPSITPH